MVDPHAHYNARFYTVLSNMADKDTLATAESVRTIMTSNVISFHFNELDMVRLNQKPGPYCLGATPYQVERFASTNPWASTTAGMSGEIFANEAFIEEFRAVVPDVVAIPVHFYGIDVKAYLLSCTSVAG